MEGDREYRTQVFIIDNEEIEIETVRRYFPPDQMKQILITAGFRDIGFNTEYSTKGFSSQLNNKNLTQHYLVKALI
jgi:hypothetical protein